MKNAELKEAIAKYIESKELVLMGYSPEYVDDVKTDMEVAFRAGAEWLARQYEKIEGELVDWYSTSDGKDYCCGVKTIDAFEVPEGFYIRKKQ